MHKSEICRAIHQYGACRASLWWFQQGELVVVQDKRRAVAQGSQPSDPSLLPPHYSLPSPLPPAPFLPRPSSHPL
jgi:hypothetical protein